MRVTAIIAVRNGAQYLQRLLDHLDVNGVRAVLVDNCSSDGTLAIARANEGRTVLSVQQIPWSGKFDLSTQLEHKQTLIDAIQDGWVVHADVDELMYSDRPGEPLSAALERVDRLGYDAVDFDEFVFLPLGFPTWIGSVDRMRYYYYFRPYTPRLVRAFKAGKGIRLAGGGHLQKSFEALYPKRMILRHYIFRGRVHARRKYRYRQVSEADLQKGWHGNRVGLFGKRIRLPRRDTCEKAKEQDWVLSTGKPRAEHFWDWGESESDS